MIPWLAVLLATAVAAVAAVAASGCAMSCSDAGWFEGFRLEMSSPSPFAAGKYRIDVDADGVGLHAGFIISADGFTCIDGCALRRNDGVEGGDGFAGTIEDGTVVGQPVDHAELRIYRTGDDSAGGPRRLAIVVRVDDVVIASRSYQPRYSRDEPNGRGCGVAITASDELVWMAAAP